MFLWLCGPLHEMQVAPQNSGFNFKFVSGISQTEDSCKRRPFDKTSSSHQQTSISVIIAKHPDFHFSLSAARVEEALSQRIPEEERRREVGGPGSRDQG